MFALPLDPELTPLLVIVPGQTRIVFTPMLAMFFASVSRAPLPISISAITAAMPMTMPSVVRKVRVGLRQIAFNAHFNTRSFLIFAIRCRRKFPRL